MPYYKEYYGGDIEACANKMSGSSTAGSRAKDIVTGVGVSALAGAKFGGWWGAAVGTLSSIASQSGYIYARCWCRWHKVCIEWECLNWECLEWE